MKTIGAHELKRLPQRDDGTPSTCGIGQHPARGVAARGTGEGWSRGVLLDTMFSLFLALALLILGIVS